MVKILRLLRPVQGVFRVGTPIKRLSQTNPSIHELVAQTDRRKDTGVPLAAPVRTREDPAAVLCRRLGRGDIARADGGQDPFAAQDQEPPRLDVLRRTVHRCGLRAWGVRDVSDQAAA